MNDMNDISATCIIYIQLNITALEDARLPVVPLSLSPLSKTVNKSQGKRAT